MKVKTISYEDKRINNMEVENCLIACYENVSDGEITASGSSLGNQFSYQQARHQSPKENDDQVSKLIFN